MHPSIDPDLQDLIKHLNHTSTADGESKIAQVVAVHEGVPDQEEEYVWIVKLEDGLYAWVQACKYDADRWYYIDVHPDFDTAEDALADWDQWAESDEFPVSGKNAVYQDLKSQIEREELYPTSRSAGMTQAQALDEAIILVSNEVSAFLHDDDMSESLAQARNIKAVLVAMRNQLGG